jgi:hypothetical protein
MTGGVSDGDRTHGHWSHNPALYQLSYTHHIHSRKHDHVAHGLNSCLPVNHHSLVQVTIRRNREMQFCDAGRTKAKPARLNSPGQRAKLPCH